MQKQDLSKLQTRKMKGLRKRKGEVIAEDQDGLATKVSKVKSWIDIHHMQIQINVLCMQFITMAHGPHLVYKTDKWACVRPPLKEDAVLLFSLHQVSSFPCDFQMVFLQLLTKWQVNKVWFRLLFAFLKQIWNSAQFVTWHKANH